MSKTHVLGTSIFDPVLAEIVYRWFCPKDGLILDPFAGGSVRGIVAGYLGYRYIGIELRENQVKANNVQYESIIPNAPVEWINGDSRHVDTLIDKDVDFVFSCPPYGNLEKYSDLQEDLSTLDYPVFIVEYRDIISKTLSKLKNNRFACFVVGDFRDKKGFYNNFVSDTIAAFQDCGTILYNEAVLITMLGSLPIRVTKQFQSSRKLGKTHQNVLIFYKGDAGKIHDIMGDVGIEQDLTSETPTKIS